MDEEKTKTVGGGTKRRRGMGAGKKGMELKHFLVQLSLY